MIKSNNFFKLIFLLIFFVKNIECAEKISFENKIHFKISIVPITQAQAAPGDNPITRQKLLCDYKNDDQLFIGVRLFFQNNFYIYEVLPLSIFRNDDGSFKKENQIIAIDVRFLTGFVASDNFHITSFNGQITKDFAESVEWYYKIFLTVEKNYSLF